MKKAVVVVVFSSLLGCSLGVPVDRTGNATCRSEGLVVFSGEITMVGESLVDPSELPTVWTIVGQDMECEINFSSGK
ncbi:MAG: hypothetical protein RMA76_33490 [Deltaproteobacteria bacterium]